MKKSLLIIPVSIVLAIFFYPTTSISNAGGSPGGKTDSPSDGASCTGCHYAGAGTGAIITTNIPANGYTPNQVYTITANINHSGINKFGFEITAEKNSGNTKTGSFLVTNSAEMKFVNNNTAITHKSGGTSGNGSRTWAMDWEAPNTGTGDVTFYGAFIAANGNGNNMGDTYHSTNLTVSEAIVNSVSNLSAQNDFTFNTVTKTIETIKTVSVYDINGKLVFSTNEKLTNISHLNKGIYILKSENKTQKIIIK
jgi:hypothetical protein